MTPATGESYEAKLASLLEHRRARGRKLFLPYLTAGLPSPQRFVELVSDISSFADAIEVGIPFSDPIMDGPVIQEASARAIAAGVTVTGALEMIREALRHAWIPVIVMCYYNPIHRLGETFLDKLSASGAEALIVPDLPYEEAAGLADLVAPRGIAFVQMISPTTPAERAAKLAGASQAFVYAVSRLGVTGEREKLDEAAAPLVERIRPHTALPILLGIGISNPEQAKSAASVADGVIVGSAIMKKVIAGDVAGAVALCMQIRKALDEQ